MTVPILTHDLADRIERAVAGGALARSAEIERLEGNPLGVHMRPLGRITARLIQRDVAYYPYFNGPLDLRAEDEAVAPELAAWYREHRRPCYVRLSPFFTGESLLARLAACGLGQTGFMSLLYGAAAAGQPETPPGVEVRFAENVAGAEGREGTERERFLQLWVISAPPEEQPLRQRLARAEFARWRCYVGYVDGQPAGHAALYVDPSTKIGLLAAGATLPEYRGRGCQSALLRRRLADAAAAGCDLVIAEASPGSISQRNMERVGLRTAYTKVTWTFLAQE